MLDYPYPTNYGIPLSGWPVNKTCDILVNYKGSPGAALAKSIGVFYNGTGDKKCFDINKDMPDFGRCCGWDYLACTEVYLPSASSGIFPHIPFDPKGDAARCRSQYGVTLDITFPLTHWGGFDAIKQSSHIIFSNGLLDPWHTSGVLESLSDTLIAIVIPGISHLAFHLTPLT